MGQDCKELGAHSRHFQAFCCLAHGLSANEAGNEPAQAHGNIPNKGLNHVQYP